MTEDDIIAAINSVRAHLESQFLATNQSIQECMIAFDNGFAALQGTRSSLPPPAGFPSSGHLLPQPPPSDPPPSYTDYRARLDEEKSKFHSGFRWAAKATPLNSVPPPQPTHTTSPSSPSPQIRIHSERKEIWDRGLCYMCDQKGSQNQPTTWPKTLELREEFEMSYQDNRTEVQEKSQGESDQGESDVHDDLISKVVHNPPALVEVTLNPWFLIQVYPKLDAVSPYHHYHLVHGTPHLLLSLPKGHKSFNSREDAGVTSVCTRDMLGHWEQDEFLGVARRLFIFSLYALEEVYKDLILHLEDKVVLKG